MQCMTTTADLTKTTDDSRRGAPRFIYYVLGSPEPLTYAQITAMRPERTAAEWERYEALEATIGRVHEDDR